MNVIDRKYREAREQIENLKRRIEELKSGHDDSVLRTEALRHQNEGTLHKNDPGASFRVRLELKGHFGKIFGLQWSSNSKDIVCASQDGKVIVWNVASGVKKIQIPLRSSHVMTCAYSPEGSFVASGGLDNLCSVFNINDSVGWEVKQPHRELQQHEGI